MFSIKAKVVDWKYLRRDVVFFFRLRPNCNYFLLPFFSFFMYPGVFFTRLVFFPSLYSQGRRWWKNAVLCTIFSHPVTKIFSPSALFFHFFKAAKKVSTKNRKMSQTMKSFLSSAFLLFSFNKDFPLIFTDAILINFHLKEIFFQCRPMEVVVEFSALRIQPRLTFFELHLQSNVLSDKTWRASVFLILRMGLITHFFRGFGFVLRLLISAKVNFCPF